MPTPTQDLLARDVYLNVVRVHDRLSAAFVALFRSRGLTSTQFNVLRIVLGGPEEGVSCQHVGERLLTRVPDVTRLLDRMERTGLVERSRSASDRRVVLVRATAEGRSACETLAEPVLELHRRQLAGLSRDELTALNEGLLAILRQPATEDPR